MKKLFTLLLISLAVTAMGQESFNYQKDFKAILKQTTEKGSKLEYGKLLKRFLTDDTTLTDYEVLALMIGYTENPFYKPYSDISEENEIFDLNGDEKFTEALNRANVYLEKHPLSVKVLVEKSYSCHKLEQRDKARLYMNMAVRIFHAMRFSGDGKSIETPMFALGPADGQDYIIKVLKQEIGTMGSSRDSAGNFLDVLEVVPKDGSQPYSMCFIIQHATDKMFSPEEKKKMEQILKDAEKEK